MFLVCDKNGNFLCGDSMLRSSPLFGTFRSCCKTYKTVGHAKRVASNIRGTMFVVKLDDGIEFYRGGSFVGNDKRGYHITSLIQNHYQSVKINNGIELIEVV